MQLRQRAPPLGLNIPLPLTLKHTPTDFSLPEIFVTYSTWPTSSIKELIAQHALRLTSPESNRWGSAGPRALSTPSATFGARRQSWTRMPTLEKGRKTQSCPMDSLSRQPCHGHRAPRNFPYTYLPSTIYQWTTAQCEQSGVHDSPDDARWPEKRKSSPGGHCGGLRLSKEYINT